MDACLGHILESTKGIEIKRGTYIDVNKRKCRRQEPYLGEHSLLPAISLLILIS